MAITGAIFAVRQRKKTGPRFAGKKEKKGRSPVASR